MFVWYQYDISLAGNNLVVMFHFGKPGGENIKYPNIVEEKNFKTC